MLRKILIASLILSCAAFAVDTPSHDDIAGKADLVVDDASKLNETLVTAYLQQRHDAGKNLLWCSTMQLCWNEMMEIAKGPLEIKGNPPFAKFLNKKLATRDDLDAGSFVALAGWGPDIIPRIKDEMQKTFKGAASPKLIPQGASNLDLIAYAYLFKNLEFETPFAIRQRIPLKFRETSVRSFGVWPHVKKHNDLLKQVLVLDYKSDADFVVELKTREKNDRLLIARLKPQKTLQDTVQNVLKRIEHSPGGEMFDDERLEIPMLNFDITREYNEMIGKVVVNKSLPNVGYILQALQTIRFKLNEKGAVLKSEARMDMGDVSPFDEPRKPRMFICDQPFLIMMMRTKAKMPYFAMWVDNAELLVPAANENEPEPKPASKKKNAGDVSPFD